MKEIKNKEEEEKRKENLIKLNVENETNCCMTKVIYSYSLCSAVSYTRKK